MADLPAHTLLPSPPQILPYTPIFIEMSFCAIFFVDCNCLHTNTHNNIHLHVCCVFQCYIIRSLELYDTIHTVHVYADGYVFVTVVFIFCGKENVNLLNWSTVTVQFNSV